jgi:hypothetical protein
VDESRGSLVGKAILYEERIRVQTVAEAAKAFGVSPQPKRSENCATLRLSAVMPSE